jgi:integrase/recombinase XerD
VDRSGLRVVRGEVEAASLVPVGPADPERFQAECVDAYVASWVARGFSPVTIENTTGTLERMLAALGRPAWEVTADDVDRVVGALAAQGMVPATRRGYVQAFKGFHRFLQVRKAAEIHARFGVRLKNPIDEFNATRHVSTDSPASRPPPTPERLEAFFEFLKQRIATARKFAPAGRDYALFRTLYHAGLRADEAAHLEVRDAHFDRGPYGKLHVRFGKGAKTSGPRPRWVPMLDHLDLILRWYLADVRSRFRPGPALFATRAAGRSTAARSATGCATWWSWRAARPSSGLPRTGCGTPAPPTTTSAAWTWSPSSRCSVTGSWAPRCGTSRPRRPSSRTPTSGRCRRP